MQKGRYLIDSFVYIEDSVFKILSYMLCIEFFYLLKSVNKTILSHIE